MPPPASDLIAVVNGRRVPLTEASLSVVDLGVAHGVAVTEILRTYHGQPFALERHLARLERSRAAVGFGAAVTSDELSATVHEVVSANASALPSGSEQIVNLFLTPGPNPSYLSGIARDWLPERTWAVCSYPLDVAPFDRSASGGVRLVIPERPTVPGEVIDPRIKHRSRLHWYLADRDAERIEPGAKPLLLDADGHLTETSTGNVIVIADGVARTAREAQVLGGVSLAITLEVLNEIGVPVERADMTPSVFADASEVLVTSTPYGVLPVTFVDGQPIGSGTPGDVFIRAKAAWKQRTDALSQ